MSFKMIREAQAIAKLGDKAAFAQKVQQILGTDSIIPIAEAFDQTSFEVTPQHYNQWLATLTDIAQERGVSISKRQAFNDIAFEILDNDSLVDAIGGDPERTKMNIVKALWQAYQVSKAHTKVQDHVKGVVAKAREDEEMANRLAGCEDEESGFEQAFNVATGVENEERSRKPNAFLRQAVRKGGKTNPYPPNTLRAALWDDAHKGGVEDEEMYDDEYDEDPDAQAGAEVEVDPASMSPEDLASHITGEPSEGGDDVAARVDDLEARVADLETGGEQAMSDEADMGEELPPEGEMSDDDMADDEMPEQEPRALVVDKSFSDEEQVKSMFRRAITAPKEQLNAALKDVESEGAKAFASMQMPQNPHPKKSPAYNAWAKGFKNSAKSGLGFADKPRESTSKQRPRKR
jgi:hypothetical protein